MFWHLTASHHVDNYNADNLSVRWLAGVGYNRPITEQDLNLAKCRLELFDLVMTDKTMEQAMTKVLCPSREWKDCEKRFDSVVPSKVDPFGEMDPIYVGAWMERQRPLVLNCMIMRDV